MSKVVRLYMALVLFMSVRWRCRKWFWIMILVCACVAEIDLTKLKAMLPEYIANGLFSHVWRGNFSKHSNALGGFREWKLVGSKIFTNRIFPKPSESFEKCPWHIWQRSRFNVYFKPHITHHFVESISTTQTKTQIIIKIIQCQRKDMKNITYQI